jgi:hypothetical protein
VRRAPGFPAPSGWRVEEISGKTRTHDVARMRNYAPTYPVAGMTHLLGFDVLPNLQQDNQFLNLPETILGDQWATSALGNVHDLP